MIPTLNLRNGLVWLCAARTRLGLLSVAKRLHIPGSLSPCGGVGVTEAHKNVVHCLLNPRIWPVKFPRRGSGKLGKQESVRNIFHGGKDFFRSHRVLRRHRRLIPHFCSLATLRAFVMPESIENGQCRKVVEWIGFFLRFFMVFDEELKVFSLNLDRDRQLSTQISSGVLAVPHPIW
jgi:hypothetical protein